MRKNKIEIDVRILILMIYSISSIQVYDSGYGDVKVKRPLIFARLGGEQDILK